MILSLKQILKLWSPLWNKFWQQNCQIFSLPAVECSDFIFVAGMYPEFENGKHMGSLKEQLWGIDCAKLDATKHWKFSKTNGYRWRECHWLGHLGQYHWIFSCLKHTSIICLEKKSLKFPVMRLVYSILFSLVSRELFLNFRKRFIRIWIVQRYEIVLSTWHMMLRKSGATAGKIWKNTIEQEHICDDCSSCFSPCLTVPHTKTYKKYQLGRSSMYDLYPQFCPTTWRNIPWLYALFLDGSCSSPAFGVASSAPEATRRCILRLWTARPPWSSSWSLRRPRWTRPIETMAVAPEGFSGHFGSGSGEVMEGVRTLAGDFRSLLWDVEWYSYLLFKDPLLWWDWPLEIWVKRNEMKRVESRRNHVVSKCSLFFKWFWAWNKFLNCDRLYGTDFDTRTVRYFHCQR